MEGEFRVRADADVLRLLIRTAARALGDARTEMTAADLLMALSRDQDIGQMLSDLGASEAAIRAALERRGAAGRPPDAAAES